MLSNFKLCSHLLFDKRLGENLLTDLKPQNVLLSEENELKLCDFGLAQQNDDENKENLLLGGTLEYCAPEQIQFEQVSVKTDVWSLGVIGTFFSKCILYSLAEKIKYLNDVYFRVNML